MIVFDKSWFARFQKELLFILNFPGIGYEVCRALGIQTRDRILKISPYFYITELEPNLNEATFFNYPSIAYHFYHEFLPIWKLIHWFDLKIANPYFPELNLGFDTLTFFPNASPGVTSCDGYVMRNSVDETWAVITAGAGVTPDDSSANAFLYTDSTGTLNQFGNLRRLFFLFDTSAIGSGSTLISGTFSVWGIGSRNFLGETDFTVVSSNPASNIGLTATDFSTLGTTVFASVAYGSFDSSDTIYTNMVLNGNGLNAVSKTSITKFGGRLDWDRVGSFTGSWVASDSTYYWVNMAENASGTSKAPKLTVVFSAPGANPFFTTVGAKRMA